MSDDSFIREVDEELRHDRFKALWQSYGIWLIAMAVLVVVGTAAFKGYDYWVDSRASKSGDDFLKALTLANNNNNDEALAALEALQKDGYGAYPVLARMRAATVLADSGETAGAVAGFDAVAADRKVPESLRDLARLRAALLLVDSGSYTDVASRAELLAAEGNPLRHSAREALGLAAWREGNESDALRLFEQILADEQVPRNLRQRAEVMADLIRGSASGT